MYTHNSLKIKMKRISFFLQGIAKAKVELLCPLRPVLYMYIVHVHIQGIIKLEVIRGKENVICPFLM